MSEKNQTAAVTTEAPPAPKVSVHEDIRQVLDEVLEEAELSRALRREEESALERLSTMPDGADLFKRKAELAERIYFAAIARTRPEDWVVNADAQGHTFAMLKASGAALVAELYDVRISNLRPVDAAGVFRPEKESLGEGKYVLKAWCDAYSKMNGRRVEHLMAARRSDEDFIGRLIDGKGDFVKKRQADEVYTANPTDLANAVHTLLLTKAVRVLCAMTRVPTSDLTLAWEKTNKKVENCVKGAGFGSADGRRAQGVASGEVKEGLEKLKAEILRLAMGNPADVAKITKEITANPDKNFAGMTDPDRIVQDWMLERAWTNLKKHPLYAPPKDAAKA